MRLPFFSVVIPLYNKKKYISNTIESVQGQTFQDFEIVIVNDGSKDDSPKIVESIQDERIRLIHQDNAGVSVARNRGIKEAKAKYIAFLDADDLWLPEFLQTIYELIQNFPDAGLYATAYKKRKENGEESSINIQGLPSKDYIGLIPNYFKSIVKGSLLVWTSATCIPKKVFLENDIWFPEGEKYGEDQYVWARVAMKYDIAYNLKVCSIYKIEAENNSQSGVDEEKDPHQSILKLNDYKDTIKESQKFLYFEKYIEKEYLKTIKRNIIKGENIYALKALTKYNLSFWNKLKAVIYIMFPYKLYKILKYYFKNTKEMK
jgi:glycosyltransferase involved in cell wall biosynthesis